MTSPFNGLWKIDLSRSRQWDWDRQTWIPDQIGREDIRMHVDAEGVLEWHCWAGVDPLAYLSCTATLDGDWAPYTCNEITYATRESEDRRQREGSRIGLPQFEPGMVTAMCKVVRITGSYLLRISRHPTTGELQYYMSNEVTGPDERISIVTSPKGQQVYYRVFNRAG